MVMEAHVAHQMDGGRPAHMDTHPMEVHVLDNQPEQIPSPAHVGLEFVRQYYTILNKAPCHLHRFYNQNSSFMHSGESSNRIAIIGQHNIHKSIMKLGFNDCHAKILLIDSQSTLADGIVIQVTGELSNRGSHMRRFMQTFVLAPQSEKKYYVHNDIFRYQDQVFTSGDDSTCEVDEQEEEIEEASASLEDTDMMRASPQVMNGTAPQVVAAPPHMAPAPVAPQVVAPPPPPPAAAAAVAPSVPTPAHVAPVQQVVSTSVPQSMGNHQHQSGGMMAPQQGVSAPNAVVQQPPAPQMPSPPTQHVTAPPPRQAETVPMTTTSQKMESFSDFSESPAPAKNNEWAPAPEAPVVASNPTPAPAPAPKKQAPKQEKKQQAPAQPAPTKPRSYAEFFKDTSSAPAPAVAQAPVSTFKEPSAPRSVAAAAPSAAPASQTITKTEKVSAQSNNMNEGGFQRAGGRGNKSANFRQRSSNYSESNEDYDDGYDRKRSSPPDTHQIFVGNLPQSVKEDDLRKTFEEFGIITDVRINIGKGKTTPAQNGSVKNPAHVVPNFGFVTFSDDSAVAKCLKSRPITILGDHRLNVEEKKTKNKGEGFGGPRPQGIRGNMGGRGGFNRMDGGRGGPRGGYNASNNRQR